MKVDPLSLIPDCLSWSAIVLSTNVQDTDGDGLVDAWETTNPPLMDVSDPTNRTALPNLAAMGANPNAKDIFVEIGFMHNDQDSLYGGVLKPAHSHLPSEEALNLVGQTFAAAPVANPDGSTGIRIHFDVGNRYQGSPYVIPALDARGGEDLVETDVRPGRSALPVSEPRGTVGWKTGFRHLRDQIRSTCRRSRGRRTSATFPATHACAASIATAATCSATPSSRTRLACQRSRA